MTCDDSQQLSVIECVCVFWGGVIGSQGYIWKRRQSNKIFSQSNDVVDVDTLSTYSQNELVCLTNLSCPCSFTALLLLQQRVICQTTGAGVGGMGLLVSLNIVQL